MIISLCVSAMLMEGSRFKHENLVGYTQLVLDEARNQVLVGGKDTLFRLSLDDLHVLEITDWRSPSDVKTSCTSTGQNQVRRCLAGGNMVGWLDLV